MKLLGRTARDRGSAPVEFVLVAPLVLFIFAAVAQVCLAMYVRSTLISCAAEGARAAAMADGSQTQGISRTYSALETSLISGVVEDIEVMQETEEGMPVMAVAIQAKLPLIGLLGPTSMTVVGHSLREDLL